MSSKGSNNLLFLGQVVFMIKFNRTPVFEGYRNAFCRGRHGRFRELRHHVEKWDEEEECKVL